MQQPHHDVPALLERISQLEAMLAPPPGISKVFGLTAAPAKLLGLLLRLPVVNREIVAEQLGMTSELRVAMCRLRAPLAKYGIEIQSRRYTGYWLTDESKGVIDALLAGEPAPIRQEV